MTEKEQRQFAKKARKALDCLVERHARKALENFRKNGVPYDGYEIKYRSFYAIYGALDCLRYIKDEYGIMDVMSGFEYHIAKYYNEHFFDNDDLSGTKAMEEAAIALIEERAAELADEDDGYEYDEEI